MTNLEDIHRSLDDLENLKRILHKAKHQESVESSQAKEISSLLEQGKIKSAKNQLVELMEFIEDVDLNLLLNDAYELLEDAQLAEIDSDYRRRLLKKAEFTLERFVLRNEEIAELGRVSEPIFESSEQAEIYRYLRGVERATYKEIADYLDVSKRTVRRRLKPLLSKNLVQKIETKEGKPVEFLVSFN